LPADDLRHIKSRLQLRVLNQQILIVLMTLIGLPLVVAGAALFAGIIFAISIRASNGALAYRSLFWFCLIIATPLLFLLEISTRGKFAEEAVAEADNVDPRVSFMAGTSGAEFVIVMIFSLLGPGLILGAYRRLRGQLQHRGAPIDRCAEVAGHLLLADVGIDLLSLKKPGESTVELLTVVEYLVHYDWAGLAHDGKRVWILTDAKKPLSRAST
jgi:hypothetical protein